MLYKDLDFQSQDRTLKTREWITIYNVRGNVFHIFTMRTVKIKSRINTTVSFTQIETMSTSGWFAVKLKIIM